MSNDLNKIALMSGKLNGTKTLKNVLSEKENPDDIEKFLLQFINLKLEYNTDNEVIYINDDQEFEEHIKNILMSQYVSLYPNNTLTRIYVTTDNKKTYIMRLNKLSSNNIAKFISMEQPIKFSLNSFNFIKWCVSKKNRHEKYI